MADLYFPELSSFKTPVKISSEDIMLRSPTDAGYVLTRPRFTRARKTYEFSWDLNDDEIFNFMNFYDRDVNYGSSSFWIDFYLNNTTRINCKVLFASPPDVTYSGIGTWGLTCKFTEL